MIVAKTSTSILWKTYQNEPVGNKHTRSLKFMQLKLSTPQDMDQILKEISQFNFRKKAYWSAISIFSVQPVRYQDIQRQNNIESNKPNIKKKEKEKKRIHSLWWILFRVSGVYWDHGNCFRIYLPLKRVEAPDFAN